MRESRSLLERMIDRLNAQRACLDRAARLIGPLTGPVIELGLGKARTYDHLRHLFPDRKIIVFDREIHAPEAYLPDRENLHLGEFRETLPTIVDTLRGRVALLHADIGSGDPARDRRLVRDIAPLVAMLMRVEGVVVADREMKHPRWSRLPLPSEAVVWSYHMYRVKDAGG